VRILTITTLYPNAQMPSHGVFVENRLRQLVKTGRLQATVVAPVPWFPFGSSIFGRYGQTTKIPTTEKRHGLRVDHPRFIVVPKLGMSVAPLFLYKALRRHVREALSDGEGFDLIDAHYVYPDGVAATWLSASLNKPVVVTARGSDLNLIAKYRVPRLLIKHAFSRCASVVAVSQALADSARALAGPDVPVEFLRNGVDLDQFREMDREHVRRELKLTGPTLISVGNLVALKGHELIIEAISLLPGTELLICGEGPMKKELRQRAWRCGVADRVRILGLIKHEELHRYYSAADVLVLASVREGWPNVVLEAMACGTPVAATAVGAVPDFVDHPHAGRVIYDRSAAAIASAVQALLRNPPSRDHVRKYASQFSWDVTTSRLLSLFSSALRAQKPFDGYRSRVM
jgi:glycosyltransferase involved in cell wall biosynthesis